MKVRRLDYYPDEYIVGVSRLSFEHQGLYWMVCSLIMSHGGPIPNDPKWLGKLGDMGAARCRRLLADLVFAGKLTEFQGKIGQKRAENELKLAQKRIEIAKENGQKGGRPASKNNGIAEPDGFSGEKLTTNYQLPTTNHQEEPPNGGMPHKPQAAVPAEPAKEAKPAKKGTRLPDDWQPSEADLAYARSKGFGQAAIDFQAERFRNFWHSKAGKDGVKLKWDATWRNWLLSEIERNGTPKRAAQIRDPNAFGVYGPAQ